MTDPAPDPSPRCPRCRAPLPPPLHPAARLSERWPHFPFCSARCRLLDLDVWLEGGYRIPGAPVSRDDPREPADPDDA